MNNTCKFWKYLHKPLISAWACQICFFRNQFIIDVCLYFAAVDLFFFFFSCSLCLNYIKETKNHKQFQAKIIKILLIINSNILEKGEKRFDYQISKNLLIFVLLFIFLLLSSKKKKKKRASGKKI